MKPHPFSIRAATKAELLAAVAAQIDRLIVATAPDHECIGMFGEITRYDNSGMGITARLQVGKRP